MFASQSGRSGEQFHCRPYDGGCNICLDRLWIGLGLGFSVSDNTSANSGTSRVGGLFEQCKRKYGYSGNRLPCSLHVIHLGVSYGVFVEDKRVLGLPVGRL